MSALFVINFQSNSPWTNDKSPQNLTRPNIMEYLKTPVKGNKTPPENSPCSYQQLSQLLAAHGLDKYIRNTNRSIKMLKPFELFE